MLRSQAGDSCRPVPSLVLGSPKPPRLGPLSFSLSLSLKHTGIHHNGSNKFVIFFPIFFLFVIGTRHLKRKEKKKKKEHTHKNKPPNKNLSLYSTLRSNL